MSSESFHFVRVAAAVPTVAVADCAENAQRIIALIERAAEADVQMVCFPELSLTGYTCADLFNQSLLLNGAEQALSAILKATQGLDILSIVGMPLSVGNQVFNCAVAIHRGEIVGVVPKNYRPNNQEFYEVRWFASAADALCDTIELCDTIVPFGSDILFHSREVCFAIELCEDLWTPIPPSSHQALAGAQLIFNLSASNELVGKNSYRCQLVVQQSARCVAGYVYASAGFGESSTDLLFAGAAFIAENGTLLAEGERFTSDEQLVVSEIDVERLIIDRHRNNCFMRGGSGESFRQIEVDLPTKEFERLTRSIDPRPFVPQGAALDERCDEIFNIQSSALAVRLNNTKIEGSVIGISGGLDSTLALLVVVAAYDRLGRDRKSIVGVTMPGFGTTPRTYQNAVKLMKLLGVTMREIDITAACRQHFADIDHDESLHDITYENTQARERTQILMDIANQCNGLVIGTGDMSELALGWATYNGDHMSMYGVNMSVPKTLVSHLVVWRANRSQAVEKELLLDIAATPISPELLPAAANGEILQKTEDTVGPYLLHDFFLHCFLRYGFAPRKIYYLAKQAFRAEYPQREILKWLRVFLRRFFAQQFKRSCMPDGPKVGSVNLSPRGDWRMPSDAAATMWLADLDEEV